MNDKQQEFIDNLTKLSLDELEGWHSAATLVNRLVNISGVSLALLVCYFPNVMAIVAGALGIFFLAKASGNITITLSEITRLITARS